MQSEVTYIHITPGCELPDVAGLRPFRAVVIVNIEVTPEWQQRVSQWLVDSGCLYMMAWGPTSSSWDDSVDHANLEQFDYEDIPDESFVMTTWHDDEPLAKTLWFAKMSCFHPDVELRHSVVVDIHPECRRDSILKEWSNA